MLLACRGTAASVYRQGRPTRSIGMALLGGTVGAAVGTCTSTAARPRCCVWSAQCGVAHARGSGVATGRRESAARHIGFESEEERRRVAVVAVRSHSPRMRQERAEHLKVRRGNGNGRHARQTQRYGSGRLCRAAPARRFAYQCAVPLLRCVPQVGRQTAIGQRYRPAV
jgi:hypothetical protein